MLGDAIVEKAASLLPISEWEEPPAYSDVHRSFLRLLGIDGFTVVERVLQRSLPEEIELPQAQDDVIRLLNKYGFATPKGHLDQALEAHARGDWASANGQLRSFFEGLLSEMAVQIDPSAGQLQSSENKRALLASKGFLDERLNEWGNEGKNFINGLWKRLHPEGSHPGLSNENDSTFRRHIVLLTSQLLLVRFDQWPKPA